MGKKPDTTKECAIKTFQDTGVDVIEISHKKLTYIFTGADAKEAQEMYSLTEGLKRHLQQLPSGKYSIDNVERAVDGVDKILETYYDKKTIKNKGSKKIEGIYTPEDKLKSFKIDA